MVHTDHQPLVQLTTKPLCEVSPRLQQLLLKVTQYNFNTVYLKHDGVPAADCLSQNVQVESALEDKTINVTVAAVSMFQEGKINQIKHETTKDLTLVKFAKMVQTGWPDQHTEIDPDLHAYWIHRWNLSIVDGVIMNGTRIIIPWSLQEEYLKCLHTGHFGVSKCKGRAKSTVYWPGIDKDITNLIGRCDTCRQVQHAPSSYDEHSVEACYPSHIFCSDIANVNGKPNFVVVDYYSFFIYERPMPDLSSETLILALKTIFSKSGVPNILITDNGRQYCSKEFKEFSLEWSFVHKTSSPHYPKGNSYAERAVDVVKEIYSKCKDDFLLGLLVHQSTPLLYSNNAKSPAQLFLGHKIATNIQYIPFGTAALMQHLRDNHDHVCRFDPDDGYSCYVRINLNENAWQKGLVVRKMIGVPDSYIVEVDGQRYCHNKCDLTLSPLDANNDDDDESNSDNHHANHDVPMATAVMPTLCPRPQLKFPKLPVQATQQKDFNL